MEIVRGAFEAFTKGGVSAILELVSSEFELELHPPTPKARLEGPEGLVEFAEEWDQAFEEYALAPERFIDNGDEVVVLARFRGRGKGSDIEIDVPVAHRWTVHEGKAVRAAFYTDRKEALEAAGLRE